jgi:hypothetical protein
MGLLQKPLKEYTAAMRVLLVKEKQKMESYRTTAIRDEW